MIEHTRPGYGLGLVLKVKPVNIKLAYEEREQIANATIRAGEIVTRFNPALTLEGLNRDPAKSLQVKALPVLGMDSDKVRNFVKDIIWKDPVGNIRSGIDVVKDVNEISQDIINAGGVTDYAGGKANAAKKEMADWFNDIKNQVNKGKDVITKAF